MAPVTFERATRVYAGSEHPAVDALDLGIQDGECLVLVGPSGCGKSTSLRMVAGLEPIDDGAVFVGDRDVTRVAPKERDVAMVFQNYALYPHMSVAENMGFALKMAHRPRREIVERVQEAARILDLEDYLGRKPRALSGGQRQRVAMGRAIVRNPKVFLMDEPLSNLDAKLRVQTRTQIAALQQRLGVTTIYVTHDQVEAMTMGDRVAVLDSGRLQQVDTPANLFARPRNVFVAGFIGSPQMNLQKGTVVPGGIDIAGYTLPVTREVLSAANGDGRVIVGFRPEALRLAEDGLRVVIDVVEELGSDAYLYGSLADSRRDEAVTGSDLVARVEPRMAPARGATVSMQIDPDDVHVFSATSGERLG